MAAGQPPSRVDGRAHDERVDPGELAHVPGELHVDLGALGSKRFGDRPRHVGGRAVPRVERDEDVHHAWTLTPHPEAHPGRRQLRPLCPDDLSGTPLLAPQAPYASMVSMIAGRNWAGVITRSTDPTSTAR